jgi:predicted RNase H-like nuclease (RuvC/YqgF family)
MDIQDSKFNYKIILAALVAVIIGILIAFYYSYAQSEAQISYLEEEKSLLVKDLTLMKTEVDRLAALNEVNEIELQDSRFRIQTLIDSVGRLNFTVTKLTEYRKELRKLEARYDSLKLKNNFLRYNNMLLSDKYEETRKQIEELRGKSSSLAEVEAELRRKNQELNKELSKKDYLKLENGEGNGFRLRGGRPIKTNKASTIEKLRGCVTLIADSDVTAREKVLYFQFLGPNMAIIEDNANTISVSGNIYSKRVEIIYVGEEVVICDFITVPEGSLQPGNYTLNVFEDQKLLTTAEFQLK